MPQAVAERLQREFGLTFAEGYGLTETAAPSHANPPERAKLQCLGMPIFGVDSRVVDPDTLRELPPGEVGEIVTSGPMLFKGYWGHPEATEAAFIEIDGKRFFRTGDLGRMDEEGYFFITDRLKRMINASGYKVWPSEVELLLYKHPAVLEACVIAARDAYRGETVKAVVVLRAEAKGKTREQDIIDWSREHMAAYKVPRIVEFVDALPKSGSGKVMWRLLQEAPVRSLSGVFRNSISSARRLAAEDGVAVRKAAEALDDDVMLVRPLGQAEQQRLVAAELLEQPNAPRAGRRGSRNARTAGRRTGAAPGAACGRRRARPAPWQRPAPARRRRRRAACRGSSCA